MALLTLIKPRIKLVEAILRSAATKGRSTFPFIYFNLPSSASLAPLPFYVQLHKQRSNCAIFSEQKETLVQWVSESVKRNKQGRSQPCIFELQFSSPQGQKERLFVQARCATDLLSKTFPSVQRQLKPHTCSALSLCKAPTHTFCWGWMVSNWCRVLH